MSHRDSKLDADSYFCLKIGFGDDFGQCDTKTIILSHYFGQTPLRNSVTMATTKVPADQTLFERVCYMVIRKVTKFQLPALDSF